MRLIRYSFNNYLGQMILTDFNGFRLFNIQKPKWIDSWNFDIDYMSMRTTQLPAIGNEIGWFGQDFLADLTDPYREQPRSGDNSPDGYFGYFDAWGLKDAGVDVLGGGPAIVTSNVILLIDGEVAGKLRFPPRRQRHSRRSQRQRRPGVSRFRGRFTFRHMQSLLGLPTPDQYEDFRIQVEAAYSSDRYFLEEYYKRPLRSRSRPGESRVHRSPRKRTRPGVSGPRGISKNFYTDTPQWLPKFDYFRPRRLAAQELVHLLPALRRQLRQYAYRDGSQ